RRAGDEAGDEAAGTAPAAATAPVATAAPVAAAGPPARSAAPRAVPAVLAVHFAIQLAMPLRHLLYPGDVCWTEEGFRFAWNVMLIEKTGTVEAHVTEPATGRRWVVSPGAYLTPYQTRMMSSQPDMILQFAHMVAADFRERGVRDPEVRVDAVASLNGRRRARLVDPTVDLARETDGFAPKRWITPAPSPDPSPLPSSPPAATAAHAALPAAPGDRTTKRAMP
ncbi:MAG TPA: HTTM domain-containing protein, partial [Kofleriaceae bacterium]|nr:HTTM domain-containing protein [Kofleriaceae bacterium]